MAPGKKGKVKGKRKKAAVNRLKKSSRQVREDFSFRNPRDAKGAAAVEVRKKTLGVEFINRTKSNVFIDKRGGEGKGVSEEERNWQQLIRQRQQMAKAKSSIFDLREEEGEGDWAPLGGVQSLGATTAPAGAEGAGAAGGEEEEEGPPRKKTRKEILQEVIQKSRLAKAERQLAREQEKDDLNELDTAFDDVVSLLKPNTSLGAFRLFGKAMVQPERKEGPPEPPEVAAPAPAAPAARKAKRHVSIRLPDGESFTLGEQHPDEGEESVVSDVGGGPLPSTEPPTNLAPTLPEPAAPSPLPSSPGEADSDGYRPRLALRDIGRASFEDLERFFEQDQRVGRASSRTLTPQEALQAAQASLQREEEAKARRMQRRAPQRAAAEGGGEEEEEEDAPMEGEDEDLLQAAGQGGAPAADKVRDVLSRLLEEFEAQCTAGAAADAARLAATAGHVLQLSRIDKRDAAAALHAVLRRLAEGWQLAALQAKKGARPRPVGAEDVFGALFAKLLLLCYPSTDFRHPVCTPLALWLSAAIAQDGLFTLQHLSLSLFRLTLLLEMVAETKRACPEALVLLCNALTLLCPAERPGPSPPPATGFPRANGWLPAAVPELPGTPGLLHFTAAEAAALPPPAPRRAPSAAAEAEVEVEGGAGEEDFPDAVLPPLSLQSQLMVAPDPSPLAKAQFIKALLQLTDFFTRLYSGHPASPELFRLPLAVLEAAGPAVPPLLAPRLAALTQRLRAGADATERQRRPAAMQLHRPVPLRLFEPLIDVSAGDRRARRTEQTRKQLRQAHSAATRQAVKAVRADTRFLQGAREAEQAVEDDRRQRKYNQLYSELQAQRQMVGQMDNPWQKKRDRLQREKAVQAHLQAKAEKEAKVRETKKEKAKQRQAKRAG